MAPQVVFKGRSPATNPYGCEFELTDTGKEVVIKLKTSETDDIEILPYFSLMVVII